jgi:hypothetical protein
MTMPKAASTPLYRYKTVQVPSVITANARGQDTALAEYMQGILDVQAAAGWEFYRVDTFTTVVPQGCLGGQAQVTPYNVITFRQQ